MSKARPHSPRKLRLAGSLNPGVLPTAERIVHYYQYTEDMEIDRSYGSPRPVDMNIAFDVKTEPEFLTPLTEVILKKLQEREPLQDFGQPVPLLRIQLECARRGVAVAQLRMIRLPIARMIMISGLESGAERKALLEFYRVVKANHGATRFDPELRIPRLKMRPLAVAVLQADRQSRAAQYVFWSARQLAAAYFRWRMIA